MYLYNSFFPGTPHPQRFSPIIQEHHSFETSHDNHQFVIIFILSGILAVLLHVVSIWLFPRELMKLMSCCLKLCFECRKYNFEKCIPCGFECCVKPFGHQYTVHPSFITTNYQWGLAQKCLTIFTITISHYLNTTNLAHVTNKNSKLL